MREFDGYVRGINNSPTTSVASGRWSVNAAARYIRNLTWPTQSIFPAQYYRLVVDNVLNATSANSVQLSEFQLRNNSSYITGATYTNGNGSSPVAEGPANAGDNNTSTKWLNFQEVGSILLITYPSGVTVTDYTWWTANDGPERDMTAWTLSASKDNVTWIVIDQISGYSPTTSRLTNVGSFNVYQGV